MTTVLLFVYGLLQPGLQPPRSIGRRWKDSVGGRLFDLGPYPGATEIGSADSTFEGWVIEIDETELAALDKFEDVTSEGQYRRVRTRTLGGVEVWIYEYVGPTPDGAVAIARWAGPA